MLALEPQDVCRPVSFTPVTNHIGCFCGNRLRYSVWSDCLVTITPKDTFESHLSHTRYNDTEPMMSCCSTRAEAWAVVLQLPQSNNPASRRTQILYHSRNFPTCCLELREGDAQKDAREWFLHKCQSVACGQITKNTSSCSSKHHTVHP